MLPSTNPTELTIDLHAAASSYTGQGVSVRGYLHYLTRRNLAIRLLDLSPGGGRAGFVSHFNGLQSTPLDADLPAAWIHVGGGGEFSRGTALHRDASKAAGRATAYHLWWELPVLLPEVEAELEQFDAVIASTRFIEGVARRHLRAPAVLYAPQPLPVAERDRPLPARARFGLPEQAVLVLCTFDPSSGLERKNPRAVLEAFRRAADRAPNLHLVVKLMLPPQGSAACEPQLRWLREAVAADPRICVIAAPLQEADLHQLFVSCDMYLSLHRAEGLGLGMLEAMHLGLPVVATAYSGNMSFMDEASACLVPFRLIPVQEPLMPTYEAVSSYGPTWADPDVEAAAGFLARLAVDPDRRAALGAAAARAAAAYQAEALAFEWVSALSAIARQRRAGARPNGRMQLGVAATFRPG